ncbi:triose-phosphate isomerase family protein [Sinomonas sp. P47F7]|uniref:triose-phosphate isomerase family protein n=1 Tax=Sinomonas sp. P47F7 TaxID=3410987 RepID=UPI003BF5DFED
MSLKMYFSHARTVEWCRAVASIARHHPAVQSGAAELFVIPTYLSVPAALELLGDAVLVGAQDLATEDAGAFTGEVSGAEIAELGCRVVEVGHAERRSVFGETDRVVRAKTAAALRNGLTPVLCVGEEVAGDPAAAARECIRQLDDSLVSARDAGQAAAYPRLIVAYEPRWAIGAAEPADPEHVRAVCAALREHVLGLTDFPGSAVIYGGSARPGLLPAVGDDVDGLFLGRFAHDPSALAAILDEVSSFN